MSSSKRGKERKGEGEKDRAKRECKSDDGSTMERARMERKKGKKERRE